MHVDLKRSSGKTFLTFQGDCTVESALAMKSSLADALNNTDELILELGEVTAVDLCLFQLICATHRATWNTRKRFSLGTSKSESFIHIAERAGYHRKTSCHQDTIPGCLWTELTMDGVKRDE